MPLPSSSAPPKTFDRALIATHFARRTGETTDFVSDLAFYDLQDRLLAITRDFTRALVMGPDGAILPTRGETRNGVFPFDRVATVIGTPEVSLVDPEHLVLPRTDYELIVSILDLQVINDVPGFMAQVRRHLVADGLFIAACLGGATLSELRQAFLAADVQISGGAFARVAPFLDLSDAGRLLQRAGFALPVADIEAHTVRYAHPIALMTELKALGASNPLADRPHRLATPGLLAAASQAYQANASEPDGRIRATLEIIWFSGWAPHERQQKPLAPGSAQVSLVDVLGNKADKL